MLQKNAQTVKKSWKITICLIFMLYSQMISENLMYLCNVQNKKGQ